MFRINGYFFTRQFCFGFFTSRSKAMQKSRQNYAKVWSWTYNQASVLWRTFLGKDRRADDWNLFEALGDSIKFVNDDEKFKDNASVIRQKGESQNGWFKKTEHAKFSEKRTFLTPWYAHIHMPEVWNFIE